jgi:hypothetical protein
MLEEFYKNVQYSRIYENLKDILLTEIFTSGTKGTTEEWPSGLRRRS